MKALLIGFLLLDLPASAQDAPKNADGSSQAQATPTERLPYSVRLWVAIDPDARIDSQGRERLLAVWQGMVERFVGQPWRVAVAPGEGPLVGQPLESLTFADIAPVAKDVDKAWLVRIRAAADGGLDVSGREFDTTTGFLGLICKQKAALALDAPRALFLLALEMFSPIAEVGAPSAGGALITVRGSALPSADALGRVVDKGSIFRPVRIFYKPDGSILRPEIVKRSYLTVESFEGAQARCSITSALRDPLTGRVAGRAKLVALGLKPTAVPSRFQFVYGQQNERKPAAGYRLTARPVGTDVSLEREVATTDREGRVALRPDVGVGLTLLRVVAGGVEPLVEFPMMPGETADEQVIAIDLKSQALTLESELQAMQDEILDAVYARGRLDALLKARAEGEAWDEVRSLLEQYKPFLLKRVFDQRLNKLDADARNLEDQIKKPVRTRMAQRLMADTRALIDRYLDDGSFNAYADGYNRWLAQSGKGGTPIALVGIEDSDGSTPPPTEPAASATSAEGPPTPQVTFNSPDGGWLVAIPATPQSIPYDPPAGAAAARAFQYGKLEHGFYTIEDITFNRALVAGVLQESIDAVRDQTVARLGGRIAQDKSIQQNGREGREITIDVPSTGEGVPDTALRMRCLALGTRMVVAMYSGKKQWVGMKGAEAFLASLQVKSADTAPTGGESQPTANIPPTAPAPKQTTPAKPAPKTKGGAVPF